MKIEFSPPFFISEASSTLPQRIGLLHFVVRRSMISQFSTSVTSTIANSVNGTHTSLMKAAMLMCACPLDSLDMLCYGYDSLGHKESILTTMSDADSFDDSYCLPKMKFSTTVTVSDKDKVFDS